MNNDNIEADELLLTAKNLVKSLECEDVAAVDESILRLARSRDQDLFTKLARLTQGLHDALRTILPEDSLIQLAEIDLPNACVRLNQIISMTETSANQTLSSVESSLPVCESLQKFAATARNRTEIIASRRGRSEDELEEFEILLDELAGINSDTRRLHAILLEILVAQEYQDLSGQSIKKVISVVRRLEQEMVALLRGEVNKNRDAYKKTLKEDKGDRVTSQDEVDDLLSGLGL